jgi:uncharacterized membrane protein
MGDLETPAQETRPMSEGAQSFNRRAVRPMQCLRDGWRLIKEEYWLFLGITLIGMFLAGLVPFYILLGPMMCGIYLCLLRRDAGQRVTFDMLFKGFDYFAQSLIATLIMVVPILLVAVPLYVAYFIALFAVIGTTASPPPGRPPDLTAFWVLMGSSIGVAIVITLISMLVFALFVFIYPLIVDRGLSGWEAVKLSVRAVRANFGGILGLLLLGWLLGMVGQMACFVGVYLVYPIIFAMIVVAYRQVFPPEGSVLFEPPPNWPPALEPAPRPEQTGIQAVPDSSPADPGIQKGSETPSVG